MSFFRDLFRRAPAESVVLIDIGTSSVAGAYARYTEQEPPVLLYTRRVPIEIRGDEPHEHAMLRALTILGDILIREGAPALARVAGNGAADVVLVSIDAPWEEISVRTEHFERKTGFVFTKSLVAKALAKRDPALPDKLLVDESIVGTILNGYETAHPYGKKVHRASAIILTSFIKQKIAQNILSILQRLYHTRRILPIAGSSLRYQAMHRAFPHERNALILDATGSLTSIMLVRKGLLVAISLVQNSATDDQTWTRKVADECAEIAKNYPLPRTIFLLAREPEIASLREKLDAAHLGSLWLSDNPPQIVSVLASHIAGSIRRMTTASPDLPLLLMALYYRTNEKRKNPEE